MNAILANSVETGLIRIESANAALARANDAGGSDAAIYLQQSIQLDLANLISHYAEHVRLEYESEQRLFLALDTYFQHAHAATKNIMQRLARHPFTSRLIPVISLRMQTLAQMAKWAYLRYEALPRSFWEETHGTYKLAEQVLPEIRTIQADYLHILMMESANVFSLSKHEIYWLDEWLSWAGQEVALSKEARHQEVFYTDLDEPRGPRRIRKPMPHGELRYWHMRSLTQRLLQLRTELQTGLMPENFLPAVPQPRLLWILNLLLSSWSEHSHRQRRAAEREPVSKWAQAVNGFMYVCQHVKNSAYSRRSNADTFVQPNSWLIQDESPNGLGAVVDAELNAWVKPGTLVALEYLLNPDIPILAVVRSLHKGEGRELHVGLEIISYTPTYVQLKLEDDPEAEEDYIPGLYLAKNEDQKQSASLILPAMSSNTQSHIHLRSNDAHYSAKFTGVQEQQAEWMRVAISLEPELTA